MVNTLALPLLTPWLAGDQPDEGMFNDIQDALEFIGDPPECRVYKTDSQTITTATYTNLSFTAATKDNCAPLGSSMWAVGDPTKVYARLPGWYECSWTVAWATAVDNKKRAAGIRWNNEPTDDIRAWLEKYHLNDRTVACGITPVFMNTGDYVTVSVWHNKGSNTNVSNDGVVEPSRYSSLHIKWVSL